MNNLQMMIQGGNGRRQERVTPRYRCGVCCQRDRDWRDLYLAVRNLLLWG